MTRVYTRAPFVGCRLDKQVLLCLANMRFVAWLLHLFRCKNSTITWLNALHRPMWRNGIRAPRRGMAGSSGHRQGRNLGDIRTMPVLCSIACIEGIEHAV